MVATLLGGGQDQLLRQLSQELVIRYYACVCNLQVVQRDLLYQEYIIFPHINIMYSCLYDGTKINFKRPGVEKSLIMNVSNENKSRKQVTVFNYT